MTTDLPPLSELMDAMSFTLAQLEANRDGALHESQTDELLRLRRRNALIGTGLFMLFVLLATTLIFFGQQNQNTILSFIGVLLTVINAVATGMFGRQWMRFTSDIRSGEVAKVEGVLERVLQVGRQTDNYVISVNGIRFPVKKEVFKQFRDETPYTLYRTMHSGILLSAEPKV